MVQAGQASCNYVDSDRETNEKVCERDSDRDRVSCEYLDSYR